MNKKERAVIDAALRSFSRTIDTDTAEAWLNDAVCTWQTGRLADALRRLYGYPPYGHRYEPESVPEWARKAS